MSKEEEEKSPAVSMETDEGKSEDTEDDAANKSTLKRKVDELEGEPTKEDLPAETAATAADSSSVKEDGKDSAEDDNGDVEPQAKKQKREEAVADSDKPDGNKADAPSTTETNDAVDSTSTEKKEEGPGEDAELEKAKSSPVEESADNMDIDEEKQASENGPTDGGSGSDGKKKAEEDGEAKDGDSPNVKSTEEKMENVDVGKAPASASTKKSDNPYDAIKYTIIENDGRPESLIKLVALKSLFSKQLPKMPRSYIARLVFDRRHISLAILNDDPATKDTDEEVIGAICYRPFFDMRFAEIAFCAVNASHQVKGYGTKLMNLVKQQGARTGIEYFITYADNYAIGYFKKQGFSKSISMPKGRFQHLIKDYDGGTMMECYVHPSIDFTRVKEMIEAQKQFVLSRIRLKANSTHVYEALPSDWKPHLEGVSRGNEAAARAMSIPGMAEAGWTMADLQIATGQGKDADRAKSALRSEMLNIVRKIEECQFSWPFREPVDTNEVKDYLDVIKEPIDLSTIEKRIRKGDYYKSKKMLFTDLTLMVNNCKLYNEEASTYVQCAIKMEKYFAQFFIDV